MDANKLIRIISKDLEELKTLTSEIADSEKDSVLIVDLALSRAKLLCQEIELLKEVTLKPVVQNEDTDEETIDPEKEPEVSDVSISEPELEIINFEVPETLEEEVSEQEEIVYDSEKEEEEEAEEISEEEVDEEVDETEEEFVEDLQMPEDVEMEVEDKRNVDESEDTEDFDNDEPDVAYTEDEDEFEEEEEYEEETADDEPEENDQFQSSLEINELNQNSHSEVREIQIEDLDEEESETIQFTPITAEVERPVMREISKPEIPLEENEKEQAFQKERSLNDVISETKQTETNLSNSPIASLKSSIGLNDRFLFIREIFSNNTDKYNMIIDHLDKLETIQQAVDYLKSNLTLQKNETSMKFVDLLKRRFTK
jgi:hypothetical protein